MLWVNILKTDMDSNHFLFVVSFLWVESFRDKCCTRVCCEHTSGIPCESLLHLKFLTSGQELTIVGLQESDASEANHSSRIYQE